MVTPNYKNLYIFGAGQARYGAGPLISAGAEALCTMVKTQQRLKHPIGAILQKIGARPPTTMLVGAEQVLRATRQANRVIPNMIYLEKVLFR
jgi:hypothetical protein